MVCMIAEGDIVRFTEAAKRTLYVDKSHASRYDGAYCVHEVRSAGIPDRPDRRLVQIGGPLGSWFDADAFEHIEAAPPISVKLTLPSKGGINV